jgi:hypothetical protein
LLSLKAVWNNLCFVLQYNRKKKHGKNGIDCFINNCRGCCIIRLYRGGIIRLYRGGGTQKRKSEIEGPV